MHSNQLDPISLRSVEDTENAPFLIESDGIEALTLYFENEANRQRYIGLSVVDIDSVKPQNDLQPEANRLTGT